MSDNDKELLNTEPKPEKQRSRFFWRNIGILFSGIAATILIIVILLVSYALLAANRHFAVALADLTNQFNNSKTMVADAQKSATSAEESMQKNTEALTTQSQLIADLQKNQQSNKNDLLVAEALYQVKMASDNLLSERNIPIVIKLIKSADQNIAKLSDSKAGAVRQALAADLLTLQRVSRVDIAGIYARLSVLNEQIDKLPLIKKLLNNLAETPPSANNEKLPWWRRGLNSMELALQRIVIVRKNSPDVPPFIAPDQQFFFYQNLHAELEKAEWALLHYQPDVYRLSLSQAINWIKQYAVSDSPVTKELLLNLSELKNIDVHPEVPDLTKSLQALQNYTGN